ncbi:M15 family metallopeptidase [Streptomyces sp. NBC_00233]|uniref:M15 family metallopeptidase n=1 Tax=Streptomyces sp. NBC_00233 TaxID=2975686 RepID=UPI002251717A|nr:M15 family metallopeptidase [Streptomyces sp. NBC_00233]MCX5233331.1 M15 family metallopeptidase [Streptomyces sp. NBC_00233]
MSTLQVAVSALHSIAVNKVDWQSRETGTSQWRTVETLRLDALGRASVRVSPWKETEYRAVVRKTRTVSTVASGSFSVSTLPAGEPVVHPRGVPEPRFGGLLDPSGRPRAVGSDAGPVVSRIPDAVWDRMVGVSFGEDCPVGRESLRYVQVNYWGFDGYRYRGEIVVHASIAKQVAEIFSDLYRLRYPIRQMRLVDDFGKNPLKGADDYAAMSADNTSGFNCRYVDGKESQGVLSPHAWGKAIDINTWENPFQARTGVFPHTAYLDRGRPHRAVFDGLESPAVHAFESHGLQWGGRWDEKDYHHFEVLPTTRSGGK